VEYVWQSSQSTTDQCVVEEEQLSADDGQVGKESVERAQSGEPIEQQVAADLAQTRKRDGVEVARLGVLDQDDCQVALDHRAVVQHTQVVHVTRYAHRVAHCNQTNTPTRKHSNYNSSIFILFIGPILYGAIAVPSVTRCRRCRRGHRCAGGVRACDSSDTWWMAVWRRLAVANGPNIFQKLLVIIIIIILTLGKYNPEGVLKN